MLVGNKDQEKSLKESSWVGYISSQPTFEEVQSCCILVLLGFAKLATVIDQILVVHLSSFNSKRKILCKEFDPRVDFKISINSSSVKALPPWKNLCPFMLARLNLLRPQWL